MRSKLTFFTIITALMLTLSACGAISSGTAVAARTISVNGSGTVYLTPDIAYINIGVHTEDADVGTAVDQSNLKSKAIIDAIKALGVAEKDIQTANFSVYNSQQYDPVTGKQTGILYMVDNNVVVTLRDLSKMSSLLDGSIAAGANNINSVSFDIADKSDAIQQARSLALENAQALAKELTEGAGVSLGEVQTLSYYDYSPAPYYGSGGVNMDSTSPSTPINPGQMQLNVNVSVVYEIK
ncbi:MAG TPA: SIMPL domain-containing protein [Anaerolineales bacterium]|nr:SIMPL domain-containing protein [Anaerolineales bacterium]